MNCYHFAADEDLLEQWKVVVVVGNVQHQTADIEVAPGVQIEVEVEVDL